jgi:hypothetical protein
MRTMKRVMFATALCTAVAVGPGALWVAETAAGAPQATKNWVPPTAKIYAQALSDEIMANHPELISVTFHGVPPGLSKVYTMFAGSFPDRIGNPDDPDDIDVTTKGITIVDPRWHRNDPQRKFVVLLPLRDAAGENIGLIVYAFKNEANSGRAEKEYFLAATALRDDLQKQIPSYAALFNPAE